jgi:hypothetical protein
MPSSTDPVPPTEVRPPTHRRTFSNEYKRRILREADAASSPGEIGALLRREGLYSSNLTAWRAARDRGELTGEARPRGPAPQTADAREARIQELEHENARLSSRIARAEALLELQKKVAELLAATLPGGTS